MTTIPQRLREIAGGLAEAAAARRGLGLDKAAELYSIASELEAPAADAVPVVAVMTSHARSNELNFWTREAASLPTGEYKLVTESAHLATVSALQARINELESARITDSGMPAYGFIPWEALIEAVCEAMTGNPKVGWERDPSYYVGHQPVDINMNSLNRIVSKFVTSAQARINELEARQWTSGGTLPPRHKNGCESITVLAWAETDDGCFQLTPAKVPHMSKGEWREVRFDHDGMGRKIVVRCWTHLPKFPRSHLSSQPDTSKEAP